MTKRIIISVINDLVTDQRVNKVATSLHRAGYDVLLVGRQYKTSLPVNERPYKIKRFKLIFNNSAFFYAFYNLRLLFFFLFVKVDIFLSNDLDVLPANFFASKIRRKKLVFDSHELFSELPELTDRKRIKSFWLRLENYFIPKLKHCYTVCHSIADWYYENHKVHFEVVRNIPVRQSKNQIPENPIALPEGKIVLYQGSINLGRGLELAIEAMQYINANLVIIGGGDIIDELQKFAKKSKAGNKVYILGRIPFHELNYYTTKADIGISIEENLGLNYYYALPNKLFDYIHAEVPVLVSDFPEMKRIVEGYKIGETLKQRTPEALAGILNMMLEDTDQQNTWKTNLKKAKEELTWENEEKVLLEIFEKL